MRGTLAGLIPTLDVNPCDGNPVAIDERSNLVQHVTYFIGSDET